MVLFCYARLETPKYLIVKSMALSLRSDELTTLSTEELLKEHARMQTVFRVVE